MSVTVTEALIKIVKKYPILYDVQHPDYKNFRKKDKVWYEIGEELNISGVNLKRKWKNIRDIYQKHLRCLNADANQCVYRRNYKNWQWAQEMEFCRPHLESTEGENYSNIDGGEFFVKNEEFNDSETQSSLTRTVSEEKIQAPLQDNITDFLQWDATDLIFLGYSKTIKKFSPKRQAILKMEIAKIIMEEEINHYENDKLSS